MAAPVQIQINSPVNAAVYDFDVHHTTTEKGDAQRRYECLTKNGIKTDNPFWFSCIVETDHLILTPWHAGLPEIPVLAQLVAEDSFYRGFEGKFTVISPNEPWPKLEGFKIKCFCRTADFSLPDNSAIRKRIQDHPMISPVLWEHLKKVEDAALKGETITDEPPKNIPIHINPPPPPDDEPKGSWIGRALNYVFCFEWVVVLWNLAFGH